MKAIVKAKEDAGAMEVRELPVPAPGPGEVLVKMKGAGICYSDVMILNNKYKGRVPVPIPMIMGQFQDSIHQPEVSVVQAGLQAAYGIRSDHPYRLANLDTRQSRCTLRSETSAAGLFFSRTSSDCRIHATSSP